MLLRESLEVMDLAAGMTVVDGTVGAAGHATEFARRVTPGGRLIGLDRDREILRFAERALRATECASGDLGIALHHASFVDMRRVLEAEGLDACDRVFLDLGVSSLQLDTPERGFSFMTDGPLDMRLDQTASKTAATWLRDVPGQELERVLRDYGGERFAGRVARAIVETRRRHRIERTLQLVDTVLGALPGPARRQRIHPATRTFQAIRIAVNDELGAVERGLARALECVRPGGRIAVIAFHSAEDRIVKQVLREQAELPFRRPIQASAAEVERNPRARSARLRCGVRRASA